MRGSVEPDDFERRINGWLGGDLVHPTHDGHNRMGEELAEILKS